MCSDTACCFDVAISPCSGDGQSNITMEGTSIPACWSSTVLNHVDSLVAALLQILPIILDLQLLPFAESLLIPKLFL